MATTFHRFPYLPWELRARIWELSAEPRTVQVITVEYGEPLREESVGKMQYKALFSFAPIPAMLQACRESRNLGVYRQSFSEVERVPEALPGLRKYVWLNLDLDMIDIGLRDLCDLKLVASSIKRLKLERHALVYEDATALCDFDNVEEVHIVCPSQPILVHCGCNLMLFYHGHLDRKRIILIDKANDRTTTLFEWNRGVEERFEPHREKWEALVEDDSDFPSDEEYGKFSTLPIIYAIGEHIREQTGGGESSNTEEP